MIDKIIRIEYKNKNLEVIGVKEFEFVAYCNLLNKKILGILYKIDSYNNDDISFDDLKNYIFNIAGNVKRIPENIKGE